MITKEQVPHVVGRPAFDATHQKVGEVGQVYLDTATGEPEWMSVRTGLLGTKETFVPLRPAEFEDNEVLIPFGADKIKHAPRVDTEGGELSASAEARLYDYYGLQYQPYGRDEQISERGEQREEEYTGAVGPAGAETRLGEPEVSEYPAEEPAESVVRSEERLLVGTEWRESGRARLRKYVVTEEQQQTIPVREERLHITHEPIPENERDLTNYPEIGEADHEVVLRTERPVVETETVPVERVRLGKETVTHDETVSRQVRKERVEVEGAEEDE